MPEVRRDKKSLSPDEMPRLTPINPLKSEKQEQNMNMVEMVTLNAYYVCEYCMENVEFSQFKNVKF